MNPSTPITATDLGRQNPVPPSAVAGEALLIQGQKAGVNEVLDLILRERLVVLFGFPGSGKTSLLQDLVFPELRRRDILPVLVRLDFRPGARPFREQVCGLLRQASMDAGVESPETWRGETLWERFHHKSFELWSPRNRLVQPLLVFDQFDEVFTLGRRRPEATRVFLDELADLAEGRPPLVLEARLDENPTAARELSFHQHPYKILLCLRAEYLPHLEELRDRMPTVALNRIGLAGAQQRTESSRWSRFTAVLLLLVLIFLPGWALLSVRKQVRQALASSYVVKAGEQQDPRATLAYLAAAVKTDRDNALARGSLIKELLQRSWLPQIGEIPEEPLALSPSGRFLATARDKETLQVWDLTAFRQVGRPIRIPAPPLQSGVQLDRNGRRVLVLQEGTAQLWDVATSSLVGQRNGPSQERAILGPGGDQVAFLSPNGIRLWEPGGPEKLLDRKGSLTEARFSPNGRLLAVFGWDLDLESGRADLWDTVRGLPVSSIRPRSIESLEISPDGNRIVIVSKQVAQIWDSSTGRLLLTLDPPGEAALVDARFAAEGRQVVTASSEAATVWDALRGAPIVRTAYGEGIVRMEPSPDGHRLLTVSNAGIAVWDTQTRRRVGERLPGYLGAFVPETRVVVTLSRDRAHLSQITLPTAPRELVFSDAPLPARFCGDRVAVQGPILRIRDIGTQKVTGELESAPAEIRFGSSPSLQASSDGQFVSAATHAGIQVWNLTVRRLASTLRGCTDCDYALSPNGRWIATFRGKVLPVHEVTTGRIVGLLPHEDIIDAFQFGQKGERIVTTSRDAVSVWDVRTGERTAGPLRPGGATPAVSAAMSPSEDRVAVGKMDGHAYILDAASGSSLQGPLLHDAPVGLVQFCAGRRLMLVTAALSTVRLWDAETGKALGEPFQGEDLVRLARCSPDGMRVLVAAGNRAWVLDSDSGQPISAPLEMDSPIQDAGFSQNSQSIRIASRTRVRVWDLPLPTPGEATELAQFAEVVAGLAVDEQSQLVELPDQSTRIEALQENSDPQDRATIDSLIRRFLSVSHDEVPPPGEAGSAQSRGEGGE